MPRKAAAKKPSSLAKLTALSAAKRRRKNPSLTSNVSDFVSSSEVGQDIIHSIGPGVGSYAAIRLAGRLARATVGQKFPAYSKHIGAGGSLMAFLASYYAIKKVRALKRYEMPILVGGGVALIQTLIQLYLPGLAWLLEGPAIPMALAPAPIKAVGALGHFVARKRERFVSPGEIESERMEEAIRTGRDKTPNHEQFRAAPSQSATAEEQFDAEGTPDDDLLSEEDVDSDLYDGVFSK